MKLDVLIISLVVGFPKFGDILTFDRVWVGYWQDQHSVVLLVMLVTCLPPDEVCHYQVCQRHASWREHNKVNPCDNIL